MIPYSLLKLSFINMLFSLVVFLCDLCVFVVPVFPFAVYQYKL